FPDLNVVQKKNKKLLDFVHHPALKTPAAFHEQIRSLERARAGNFLKHKLCSRPERSELVRMHILQETQAEPSLQATQMKLKRARLADDLNEKIAQRPGPMELVEKNILPVDSGVKEVINDVYSFDEDSSDALSPEPPASQESMSSSSGSPRESGRTEATPSFYLNSPKQVRFTLTHKDPVLLLREVQLIFFLILKLSYQSLPRTPGDKGRSKKSKEPKPRVKKLKYHQYIPPDQKPEHDVPMDSAYARLLQQQQQFLQLQILSQQQQQYSYQTSLPVALKPTTEVQTSCSGVILSGNTASGLAQPRHIQTNRKPDHLPANLDEMKVAELKMLLKLRSLPVSGTKTDLIERLKLYQENSNIQTSTAAEIQSENAKITPPVSPIASKVSSLGIEDSNTSDSHAKLPDTAPCISSPRDSPTETKPCDMDSEKDKRLHEKERQIEELMRKLEQEQRLVEELKMQLEVEKRSQQGDSPPQLSPLPPVQVKEENRTFSNCSATCTSPALRVGIKQEEAAEQSPLSPPNPFIISRQSLNQPDSLQTVQAGAQILLPTSLPASAVTIQLPTSSINLTVSSSSPGLIQTSGQMPQKIEVSAALQQQLAPPVGPPTPNHHQNLIISSLSHFQQTLKISSKSVHNFLSYLLQTTVAEISERCLTFFVCIHQTPCGGEPTLILQTPKFTNSGMKSKDPPRYEDAVKQTRSMLTAAQGPSGTSQQMDDLFDVLIESGEISPFIRQDPLSVDKPLPVTASVTTLPINTVLSRPPALVQVAQLPAAPLDPPNTQLETLLHTETQTLKLMEELHSPLVTMEVDFDENTPPSALNLHNTNMDSMDWLDLTLSVPTEGVHAMDMSTPVGVFSSDFLDSHEMHLSWD
uniref:Myocardin related transcription factor Bb n=1 Tax=Sphaeramia orbicularis TaxID=375764 RepID=A0A672YAV6_9TELE